MISKFGETSRIMSPIRSNRYLLNIRGELSQSFLHHISLEFFRQTDAGSIGYQFTTSLVTQCWVGCSQLYGGAMGFCSLSPILLEIGCIKCINHLQFVQLMLYIYIMPLVVCPLVVKHSNDKSPIHDFWDHHVSMV